MRWGKREGDYTVTTRMTCIKMGSDKSHFNVSLIVRDKVTRQCPETTTFEEKGEPKGTRTETPVAARFVTTARFVTKVTKSVKFDALIACTFCHSGTFCHYVMTKRTERSTRCTFCHPFASNIIICLSLLSMCLSACVRAPVCVCVHPCVCIVLRPLNSLSSFTPASSNEL